MDAADRSGRSTITLRRLARLGEAVAAQQTVEGVHRLLVHHAGRLIGAQRILLALGPAPRRVAAARLPDEEDADFLLAAVTDWLDEAAARRRAILRHLPEGVAAIRQRSCLAAPLVARGAVLGHLYADVDGGRGRFDEDHRDALAILAQQAGAALDDLQSRKALQRSRVRQSALADVLGRISAAPGDGAVFDAILAACRLSLHGALAGLNLLGDDGLIHLRAYQGPCAARIGAIFPLPLDERSGSGRCILQARAIEYADLDRADGDLPAGVRSGARAIGFRSLAFMPLIEQGRARGVLWVARQAVGALSPARMALLCSLADGAAIALRDARLTGQVQQAQAAAQAAGERERQLLGQFADEIRAAVDPVRDASQALLATALDAEQRARAVAIDAAGDVLLALGDEACDLARIEAGAAGIERRSVDLRALVESALEQVAPHAQRRQLDLACLFEGEVPGHIVGDAARLRRRLLNLLYTALRCSDRGEVVATVRHGPDGVLRVQVGGTDLGGDEQRWRSPRAGGTDPPGARVGLGWAIGLRLAELLGATLRSDSARPGARSTLHLSLPAPAATPARSGSDELDRLRSARADRRVLVVDDSSGTRQLLAQQLERRGMVVADTRSPAQALAWLREGQRYELAIVGLDLPGMDGVDLARRLHEIDAAMPRVLFGALDGRDDANEEARLFRATLARPLRPSALAGLLDALFVAEPAQCEQPS